MVDRLRALLDRPLDPSAARAILVFASAILVGFAALFVLAAGQPDRPTSQHRPSAIPSFPGPAVSSAAIEQDPTKGQAAPNRQDPQDVEGSAAARRAAHALRLHRALQHVPFRHGELRIALAGARGDRAVLRITAPTVGVGKRGWHWFLHRYQDSGRAYVPVFGVAKRTRGGA